MSVIAWGIPTIFIKDLSSNGNNWTKIDTPKEGTTQVTPTKGDTQTATEEGGGTVDRKTKKSTYELAYQLFIKKGVAQPFVAIDGIVEGNYAVAVQPEDPDIPGVYMGKTTIGVEEAFTSEDGALNTYTHSALIPDGDTNASVTNSNGETVYCSFCWRVIKATKVESKQNEYTLTFTAPTVDSGE